MMGTAVACPLEGIDLSGARRPASRNAMNTTRRHAADDAHVIFGTAVDESLGDQLRVTVIATGLHSAACQAAAKAGLPFAPQERHAGVMTARP